MTDPLSRLTAALSDRYAIERELGSGGMATVYLAEDLKHNRQVAVKVFRPAVGTLLGTERFLREIGIAARLQHPHILPLHDSGSADGLLYYVMPYVEGESLADRLRREGPVTLETAMAITREVASALQYAHRQGVLHRDIKPANILLLGGHAVVADFGIARAVSAATGPQITEEGMAVGTPAYMSPEQATAEPGDLDERSDIYSLGCVLYEMLVGKPLYTGPTAQAIFAQIITGEPPDIGAVRSDVPRNVARAVSKALSKSPNARFRSAAAFGDSLRPRGERGFRVGRSQILASAFATALVVTTAWWLRPTTLQSVVAPDAEVIAVAPFSTSGPAVQFLSEGMVDLLSTNLDAVGGIRTIDPRTVLHQWRERSRGGPLDLEASLAVGRSLDAGRSSSGVWSKPAAL